MSNKLQVEYVDINSINPYPNNAKLHPAEQIEQIKKSIEEFGMNDPIGVWHDEVVEGHGRLIACNELGYKEVPIIRLDELDDEQRRAYMLVHNQLTINSGFDLDLLNMELDEIAEIDMEQFGFKGVQEIMDEDNPYTQVVNIPQYEVKGERYQEKELYDVTKYNDIIKHIDEANVDDEIKQFLRLAAGRHIVLNFKKIAEYYAAAEKDVQELMEEQALVILDVNDAIARGYALLKGSIEEAVMDEE